MKRPLRYRTMGAVREGRGNPSPYSIFAASMVSESNIFGRDLRFRSSQKKVSKELANRIQLPMLK